MNPYDFVRIDWSNAPTRRRAAMHHKFEGVSGQIEGTFTTVTPLFIPAIRFGQAPTTLQRFIKNKANQAIIPGSSLKGLFRSLVETVGPGCWWLYDGTYGSLDYSGKVPSAFKQCRSINNLCPACRMFGLINGGTILMGQVNFDDALCSDPTYHEAIFTPILDGPKPRHRAWYLDENNTHVAGRKFYFHQPSIRTTRELRKTQSGVVINQHIQPVAAETAFTFSVSFNNLLQDELSLLLYALVLEPALRHKIGYAKPAGLGTVQVKLNRLTLIDYATRYTTSSRGQTTYTADNLDSYVAEQVAPFVNNNVSMTLQDLRRVWAWPPAPGVQYGYPTRDWFEENPEAVIAETIDAPRQQ